MLHLYAALAEKERRLGQMTAIPSDLAGARQAEDVQSIRLEAAVSNMAQGLCMFDTNQRLVICNQQYATLYQLPPERLRPGTGFPWFLGRDEVRRSPAGSDDV